MANIPILNDRKNPLISILIYNYSGQKLQECLESIITQTALRNFEIILVDDSSSDGSWTTAVDYAYKYDGLISLTRNKVSIGPALNLFKCFRMSRGKYLVPLYFDKGFRTKYVSDAIISMECNASAKFLGVYRDTESQIVEAKLSATGDFFDDLLVETEPLVSVCIYNYNYGRYLRQCFDSVFAQTYSRFEICFSDNASTDDSFSIALEYMCDHPGVMTIIRNRKNFGPSSNLENCQLSARGKYQLKLCSDDAIQPEFLEKAVSALESHVDAGFVMVHRSIIDEAGNETQEMPFYGKSCVIPGDEQAAVYMMSSVNPSISQVLYNTQRTYGKRIVGTLTDRWFGDWIQDFNMCCEYSMVYLNEPLLLHRVHAGSDGSSIDKNLIQCFAQYVLFHQFAGIASSYGHSKAECRLSESITKLSTLCLRYSIRFLCSGDEESGRRYYYLALAIDSRITVEPSFSELSAYWNSSDTVEREQILYSFKNANNLLARSISYDPPPGSILL